MAQMAQMRVTCPLILHPDCFNGEVVVGFASVCSPELLCCLLSFCQTLTHVLEMSYCKKLKRKIGDWLC